MDEMSWGHVTRHFLPLDESELQKLVVKSRKSKTSVARALARLTSYQQRQIGLLITERCLYATAHRFQWTIQAVETFPKRSKPATCESIQVILERHLSPGAYLGSTGSAAVYPVVIPGPGPYVPPGPTHVTPLPANAYNNTPWGYYYPNPPNGQYGNSPQMGPAISNAHRSRVEATRPSRSGHGPFAGRYPLSKVLPPKPRKMTRPEDSTDNLISRWTVESVVSLHHARGLALCQDW